MSHVGPLPNHLFGRDFRKRLGGFTLFEMILYVALGALLSGALLVFQWNIVQLSVKEEARRTVVSEARLVSERVASLIRNAESVDWAASALETPDGRLVLRLVDTSETLALRLENGRLSSVSGNGNPVALHSDRTVVTELRFDGYRPDDGSVEYVEMGYTIRSASDVSAASFFATETTQTVGVFVRQTNR